MFEFNLGIDLEAMQRQNEELRKLNARAEEISANYCSGDPERMEAARKQLHDLTVEMGSAKFATMEEFDKRFFDNEPITL